MNRKSNFHIHSYSLCICLFACLLSFILNEFGHHTSTNFHSREILKMWMWNQEHGEGDDKISVCCMTISWQEHRTARRLIFCIFHLSWNCESFHESNGENPPKIRIGNVLFSFYRLYLLLYLYRARAIGTIYCHFCQWPRTTNHKANDYSTQIISTTIHPY